MLCQVRFPLHTFDFSSCFQIVLPWRFESFIFLAVLFKVLWKVWEVLWKVLWKAIWKVLCKVWKVLNLVQSVPSKFCELGA